MKQTHSFHCAVPSQKLVNETLNKPMLSVALKLYRYLDFRTLSVFLAFMFALRAFFRIIVQFLKSPCYETIRKTF